MVSLSVQEIALATRATVLTGFGGRVEGEVVIDSRRVGEGSVFVAFRGEHVDGNDYMAGAIRDGVAAVVASAPVPDEVLALASGRGCAVLRAERDDCEEFLLRLAAEWRRRHGEWLVIGVTGSVGKTTTKDMLRRALSTGARTHATAGNLNNLIGLPLTVLSAPEGTEVLVCELGMNHPGEIGRLAAVCQPTLAVITNIGTSHLGLLGSRENIARAKAEVVGGMRPHGGLRPCLALTSSNDYTDFIVDGFARPAGVGTLLVGESEGDDVRACDVSLDREGLPEFSLAFADGWSKRVRLPFPGRQAVADFLLAMAIADQAGMDRGAAAEAVSTMPVTSMRLAVQHASNGMRVIDDSYNAAPNSMAAALDVLCEMSCEGRRVAVLGEMGELGAEEARLHALVGAYVAAKPVDMAAFVGGRLASEMADAARVMGLSDDRIHRFATVGEALSTLAPALLPDDLVLVKASRAAGLDGFVRGVLS